MTNMTLNQNSLVVHARFGGRSFDVPLASLDVGHRVDDAGVKRALARHLEIAPGELADHVVDRHPSGNLTVRPQAVFG